MDGRVAEKGRGGDDGKEAKVADRLLWAEGKGNIDSMHRRTATLFLQAVL